MLKLNLQFHHRGTCHDMKYILLPAIKCIICSVLLGSMVIYIYAETNLYSHYNSKYSMQFVHP
jgi:hypothetical protein